MTIYGACGMGNECLSDCNMGSDLREVGSLEVGLIAFDHELFVLLAGDQLKACSGK